MSRPRIREALPTGVRAIDGFLTIGRGQRVGIFSGSGVGKSVLIGQIARNSAADVTVVGLVGERGREVREFLDKNLGEEGLQRSVVVAVTSDDLALRRIKGAFTATTIAESFRDRGLNVLLFIDSITRFAYAQRELGLSIGEPPTTRGYTPSVFATLPRLLERAGNAARGSITGIYNVLVEGDDMDEPVADTARSILDGHIVLSRELTLRGHYPAIDILASLSRLMPDVADPGHLWAASAVRRLYAVYRHSEDLIRLGAYVRGTSAELDLAVSMVGEIDHYLRQPVDERVAFGDSVERLVHALAAKIPKTV
jgi:FliI/YscN family ATPase